MTAGYTMTELVEAQHEAEVAKRVRDRAAAVLEKTDNMIRNTRLLYSVASLRLQRAEAKLAELQITCDQTSFAVAEDGRFYPKRAAPECQRLA